MIVLISFAFLAGVVTILSPCILPILPIVLSSSVSGGKRRPFGVVTGFIISFTFFTLFLTAIVKAIGIPADSLRVLSVLVVGLFGVSLLVPRFQLEMEKLFSKLSGIVPTSTSGQGFFGGLLVGISIGLIWTPCVGPILASVISLALTGEVTQASFMITLAYSVGTALPMLAILYGGKGLLSRVPTLVSNTGKIQKAFGMLMILTAIGIHFNYDRKIQTFVLDAFPSYGTGLTKLEENQAVQKELQSLRGDANGKSEEKGRPMFEMLEEEGTAPNLIPGGEWVNSDPLTLEQLRGKVVLIDFWTYTCINCIRTLPYLKSWNEKYGDEGLVIIGVHTPEFEFEKDINNLKDAVNDFELTYPIMQDNDYATWRAYDNHYWPAKYLIDAKGNIRYHHYGEGDYDETEKVIQTLLKEAGTEVNQTTIDNPEYTITARTPELYLGYGRIEYFQSPERIIQNAPQEYSAPNTLLPNRFAYTSTWEIGEEYAKPTQGGSLILNFEASEVFLVMRSKNGAGRIEVTLDGQTVDATNKGADVDDGIITVDKDRLYKLIRLDSPGKHTLKLIFQDNNLELFAFTFG